MMLNCFNQRKFELLKNIGADNVLFMQQRYDKNEFLIHSEKVPLWAWNNLGYEGVQNHLRNEMKMLKDSIRYK
jgi:hypothetical protein